jgi:hypothetical protein
MWCAILELDGAVVVSIEGDPNGGSRYQWMFWDPNVGNIILLSVDHLE